MSGLFGFFDSSGWFRSLNETNQINHMNQKNQTNQIDWINEIDPSAACGDETSEAGDA